MRVRVLSSDLSTLCRTAACDRPSSRKLGHLECSSQLHHAWPSVDISFVKHPDYGFAVRNLRVDNLSCMRPRPALSVFSVVHRASSSCISHFALSIKPLHPSRLEELMPPSLSQFPPAQSYIPHLSLPSSVLPRMCRCARRAPCSCPPARPGSLSHTRLILHPPLLPELLPPFSEDKRICCDQGYQYAETSHLRALCLKADFDRFWQVETVDCFISHGDCLL